MLAGGDIAEEHEWCYVFPWNTARYVETRNIADIFGPGGGPIVVVKETGDTWMMQPALGDGARVILVGELTRRLSGHAPDT